MSNKVQSLGTVGSAANGITCSSSTNATPIVLTIAPSTTHRLKNGDRIVVSGITGNTAANGEWTVRAIAATTATLDGSVGNGTHGGTAAVAVLCDRTPFLAGHAALVMTNEGATPFVGTALIESSDDNTTFGDAATAAGGLAMGANSGQYGFEVTLKRYMRLRASAWTSGTLNAQLVA